MTQEQINELRKLAEAATPGPWAAAISSNMVNGVCATFETICETGKNIDDALYIAAANPAAILAMIQQRDELLSEMRVIEDILNRETNTTDIGYEVFRQANFIRRAIETTERKS